MHLLVLGKGNNTFIHKYDISSKNYKKVISRKNDLFKFICK